MSYKIFISATYKDLDLARDLARRLEGAGVEVFEVGKSVAAGEAFGTKITRALQESDEIIVIFTANSIDNPNLIYELGAAFGLHKRVTPVVVGVQTTELPPMIQDLPYVKYSDVEDYIAKLAKRAQATTVPS